MQTVLNQPSLWQALMPAPAPDAHKYDRGHAVIIGAAAMTGATRLAAETCALAGAGVTSVIAPRAAAAVYRSTLPAHIIVEDQPADIAAPFFDARRNVIVLGPGFGRSADEALRWFTVRQTQHMVLDADGLNALARATDRMGQLRAGDVLTPHEGEFGRLFNGVGGDKTNRVLEAARKAGCVVLLKGASTVISDGARIVENTHATPWLATAGTGDVLAGLIGSLVAQGMPGFDAACAAAWIHGEAGRRCGPYLVASDLAPVIRDVLRVLHGKDLNNAAFSGL